MPLESVADWVKTLASKLGVFHARAKFLVSPFADDEVQLPTMPNPVELFGKDIVREYFKNPTWEEPRSFREIFTSTDLTIEFAGHPGVDEAYNSHIWAFLEVVSTIGFNNLNHAMISLFQSLIRSGGVIEAARIFLWENYVLDLSLPGSNIATRAAAVAVARYLLVDHTYFGNQGSRELNEMKTEEAFYGLLRQPAFATATYVNQSRIIIMYKLAIRDVPNAVIRYL
jgi:hypothetical protein